MSDFVTTQRFEDHLKAHEVLENKCTDMEKEIGTKVSWVVFWSIFSVLVTVMIIAFGSLYSLIKEVQVTSNQTKADVSYIRGVLDNAKVTK
jgi:hypothetical protein